MRCRGWQNLTLGVAAAALGVVGCKSPPPAAVQAGPLGLPPGLEASTAHHGGSFLGGPTPFKEEALDEERDGAPGEDATSAGVDAVRVHCSMLYVEQLPAIDLPPLATQTRLVAAPQSPAPLLPTTVLAQGAFVARGEALTRLLERIHAGEWGRVRTLEAFVGALPSDATTTFSVGAIEEVEDRDNFLREYRDLGPAPKQLGVHVSRGAGEELDLAIVLEGLAPSRQPMEPEPLEGEDRASRLRPGASIPQRELIVPDQRPEVSGGPYAVVVPSPFDTGEGRAFAVVVEVTRPGDPQAAGAVGEAAVAESLAAIRSSSELAAERRAPLPPDDAARRALNHAFATLDPAGSPRSALLYLADRTSTELACDLALVANGQFLGRFTEWLVAEPGPGDAPDEPHLAWHLERTAFHLLSTELMESELAPELEAILLRHAGEVGRYPSMVTDLLGASVDLPAFQGLLVEENRFFLEDANPASRVRAYDWLAARDLAPAGYDPMGSVDARRAALAAEPETTGASTPAESEPR